MENKFNLPFNRIIALFNPKEGLGYMEEIKNNIKYINGEDILEFRYVNPAPEFMKEYINSFMFGMENCGSDFSLNGFSWGLNHYWAIKTSYDRGFNRILIIENNSKFIWWNDDLIQQTFDLIKENDYPICKLHTQTHMFEDGTLLSLFDNKDDGIQEFTNKEHITKQCGTACYCLNRRGMEIFIEAYNTNLQEPSNEFGLINHDFIWLPKYKLIADL